MWLLVVIAGSLLTGTSSDLSSSGVPCYMHPAADGCHYKTKPVSETCATPRDRAILNERILLVNRTLVSLEKQLIKLGISK